MAHGRPHDEVGEPPPRKRRPPVVIVEDDENIAFALEFLLESEGFKAVVLRDGRAAADLIERLGPPRLVLLDMKLPYVDGMRLVSIIRAKPSWAHVPILVLSSVSETGNVQRALEAGATEYLVKPFETEKLLQRVRHLTSRVTI